MSHRDTVRHTIMRGGKKRQQVSEEELRSRHARLRKDAETLDDSESSIDESPPTLTKQEERILTKEDINAKTMKSFSLMPADQKKFLLAIEQGLFILNPETGTITRSNLNENTWLSRYNAIVASNAKDIKSEDVSEETRKSIRLSFKTEEDLTGAMEVTRNMIQEAYPAEKIAGFNLNKFGVQERKTFAETVLKDRISQLQRPTQPTATHIDPMQNISDVNAKLSQKVEELEKHIKDLPEQIKLQYDATIQELQHENARLSQRIANDELAIAEYSKEKKTELAGKDTVLQTADQEIRDLREKLRIQTLENKRLHNQSNEFWNQNEQLRKSKDAEITALRKQIDTEKSGLEQLMREKGESERINHEIRELVREQQEQLDELKNKVHQTESDNIVLNRSNLQAQTEFQSRIKEMRDEFKYEYDQLVEGTGKTIEEKNNEIEQLRYDFGLEMSRIIDEYEARLREPDSPSPKKPVEIELTDNAQQTDKIKSASKDTTAQPDLKNIGTATDTPRHNNTSTMTDIFYPHNIDKDMSAKKTIVSRNLFSTPRGKYTIDGNDNISPPRMNKPGQNNRPQTAPSKTPHKTPQQAQQAQQAQQGQKKNGGDGGGDEGGIETKEDEDEKLKKKLDTLFGKLYPYDAKELHLKEYQPDKKHQSTGDDSDNKKKWFKYGSWDGKYHMHDYNWNNTREGKWPTTWEKPHWNARQSAWGVY